MYAPALLENVILGYKDWTGVCLF